MKKIFKFYIIIWAVLLALFNVIAFVSVGWIGQEKYTASFWTGYGFITISFIGQLVCSYFAFDAVDAKKFFYNVSLLKTSYSGLVASFVFGGLCMLVSPMPYWAGVILCACVLALNVISVVKSSVAIAEVERVEQKVQTETFFIKSLTAEADTLIRKAKTEETKKLCVKVYEAVRFSNKTSNPALSSLEAEITDKFSAFSNAVNSNNEAAAKSLADELVVLLEDRVR